MRKHFFTSAAIALIVLLLASCSRLDLDDFFQDIREGKESPDRITVTQEDLFPEGIEYDKLGSRFLLTSVRYGTIGEVENDGQYEELVDDEELISTIGIQIDYLRQRMLVAVADAGMSVKSSEATIGRLAAIAAYDLYSGERLFYTDLGSLRPDLPHFANDIAIDEEGNAYVTDSFSGIIYKVDEDGNAEIFYENEALAPTQEGAFGLNGIVYDLTGYLLVAKSDEGQILHIPLDDPDDYQVVDIPVDLPSPDGLYLQNPDELIVVNNAGGMDNGKVYTLKTRASDWWNSARVVNEFTTPEVFPTTATVRNGHPYVLYAYLHELMEGESRSEFQIVKVE